MSLPFISDSTIIILCPELYRWLSCEYESLVSWTDRKFLSLHSFRGSSLPQAEKKKKSQNLPSSAFHSTQTLSRWDDTRPHWREQSTALGPLIQTLTSSVNTHLDTLSKKNVGATFTAT